MCGVLVAQVLQRSCSWPAQVAVLLVFDENKGVGAAKIRGKTFRPKPHPFCPGLLLDTQKRTQKPLAMPAKVTAKSKPQ